MSAITSVPVASRHPWVRLIALRRFFRLMMFDLIVLIACILPGNMLAQRQLQEPWNTFRLTRAELSMTQGTMADYTTSAGAYRPEHLGSDLLHTVLINATDWPLEGLVLVPIGTLILAFAYYGIAILLSPSRWWAAGITLFWSWYYPGIYSQFGTQTYVWVYSLLIGFLIIFFQWLKHPKRLYELLLSIMFLATFLHYHTTPLWMIGLMLIGVGGKKLAQRTTPSSYRYSWLLPLSWVAWDIVFESVLRNGLQHLHTFTTTTIGQSLLSKVFGPLLQRTPAGLDPFEIAPVNPPLATWSTLLCFMVLTVPVGWWVVTQLRTSLQTRALGSLVATPRHIFTWAIIGIAVAHTTMYVLYGAFSVRVIPILFPLLLPLLWHTPQWKRWGLGLVIVLSMSAMIGFLRFVPTLQPDMTAQQTGYASRLLTNTSTILSDANLYGSLALHAASDHQVLNLAWIDSDNYRAVIEGKPLPPMIDYIAIEKTTKPLITSQWQYFAAWMQSNPLVEQHPHTNQIYTSANLSILQPANHALPTATVSAVPVKPASWVGAFLRMLFTIIGLFLVPGLAIMWLLQQKHLLGNDLDIRTILACTIAFSVANVTLISYGVFLSGIRLQWIIVLALIIPVGSLVVMRFRGHPLVIAPRWWRYGISILIVIGCWLGFATHTLAAQATTLPDMEVFTTQATAGSITIHLANNTTAATTATLVIEHSDGTVVWTTNATIPAQTIVPVTWAIPATLGQKPSVIRVLPDQRPALTLWFAQLPAGN